jgi:hypothetical protein
MSLLTFLFGCRDKPQPDSKLFNIDNIKNDYDYFVLYKGEKQPEEKSIEYFTMEKLGKPLVLRTYQKEKQHIIKLPEGLELYLYYNFLGNLATSRKDKTNTILYAKNKKDDSLSYFLLFDSHLYRKNDGEYYLGVFNKDKQNFVVDLMDIIGGSFAGASTFLNKKLINENFSEYSFHTDYDIHFIKDYSVYDSSEIHIPAVYDENVN